MNGEVWRDVSGYEGYYQVSNLGRVKRVGGKVLKPVHNGNGYVKVQLCKDAVVKKFFVHRLVAIAFVSNPRNVNCVNHLDENPLNNRADNLEWVTKAENNRYGTMPQRISATLKEYFKTHPNPKSKPVRCVETGVVYESLNQANRLTGVDFRNISECIRNKRHTAGGFHWELA